jgi:diguanylate cyclase (GGDEF)-like protein
VVRNVIAPVLRRVRSASRRPVDGLSNVPMLGETADAQRLAQLGRFVRWLIPVTFLFTAIEVTSLVFFPQPAILLTLAMASGFGIWLVFAWRRSRSTSIATFATRMSLGILAIIVTQAIVEPDVSALLSVAALLPVIIVLPYLEDGALLRFFAFTWAISVFVAVMGEVMPTSIVLPAAYIGTVRVVVLAVVFGLLLFLLWQFASRLKTSARELGSLVELSADVLESMDPRQIGDMTAAHLARATGADECGICYWDRAGDRVLTYGYYPEERRSAVDDMYDLNDYPATRRVLTDHVDMHVGIDEANADPAEVEFLGSIGMESMAMLPLVARGEAIGAVELYWRKATSPEEARLGLGRSLAQAAAIALDNARLYEEIRHQAFHDALTGLANRALFGDRVEHALARSGRSGSMIAVLFLDLDDFKTVNDRFGHQAGDHMLRAIAERLMGIVRPGDTAARLGGDEFAVLLEDVHGPDDARLVAERLIQAIRTPTKLGDVDALVGASIGIALPTAGGERAPDLLRNADFAMYRAKGAGKGRYEIFEASMRAGIAERAELEQIIHGAVDRGELRVAFQPIVELVSGKIVGAEALVRWHPAGRPLLMPADFITLAEENGQIVTIGRWVLEESCRLARRWQDQLADPTFGISVNLSARQFQHPDLVRDVTAALENTGLPPSALTLEITESVLMQHTTSTIETLGQLRAHGVRLAIDDFGTGYSSLSYLDRFSVDALKIDRTFVDGFGADREGPVLVRAIIELGQALGLEVVAEGIERADQLDPLRALGCRLGQGYLFSRPLEADALSALIADPAFRPETKAQGAPPRPRTRGTRRRRSLAFET